MDQWHDWKQAFFNLACPLVWLSLKLQKQMHNTGSTIKICCQALLFSKQSWRIWPWFKANSYMVWGIYLYPYKRLVNTLWRKTPFSAMLSLTSPLSTRGGTMGAATGTTAIKTQRWQRLCGNQESTRSPATVNQWRSVYMTHVVNGKGWWY